MSKSRPALYLRVSTDEQSLDNQRAALHQWATAQGWPTPTEYTDVMSGAKRERPGFDALLKDIQRGKINTVGFWAIDRAGRSLKDLLELSELAKAHNVRLFFYKDVIDTSTPSGQLFFTIMAAIAEFERGRIIERIHAGLDRARAQGKQIGRSRAYSDHTHQLAKQMLLNGESILNISKTLGLSRTQVYHIKRTEL